MISQGRHVLKQKCAKNNKNEDLKEKSHTPSEISSQNKSASCPTALQYFFNAVFLNTISTWLFLGLFRRQHIFIGFPQRRLVNRSKVN